MHLRNKLRYRFTIFSLRQHYMQCTRPSIHMSVTKVDKSKTVDIFALKIIISVHCILIVYT